MSSFGHLMILSLCETSNSCGLPKRDVGLLYRVMGMVFLIGNISSIDGAALQAADPPSIERDFFDALRQRRMFDLAETECRQQLTRDNLTVEQRIDYEIELARTQARHARHLIGDLQKEKWSQATATLDQALDRNDTVLRRAELNAELALIVADRASHECWEIRLNPTDSTLIEQCSRQLADSIARLQEAERGVTAAGDSLRKRATVSGESSARRLHELELLLRVLRADQLMERSRLFDPGSAERINALIDAENLLRRMNAIREETAVTRRARLLLLRCHRLNRRTTDLEQRLAHLESETLPLEERMAIIAERARLLIDNGRFLDAASLLIETRRSLNQLTGELHYLKLRALIQAWSATRELNNDQLAGQLLEQIETNAVQADAEAGGYWARRCRQSVSVARQAARLGGRLAQLIRQARLAYQEGRIDESAQRYEEAIEEAIQQHHDSEAAELTMTLASIELDRDRLDEAKMRFRERHRMSPDSVEGQSAHLLWAYSQGRIYDRERTQESREAYVSALEEHRRLYSGTDSGFEATWMRARLAERRLQYTTALDLFRTVPPQHRRAEDAQLRTARAFEKILDRLAELKRSDENWREDARRILHLYVDSYIKNDAQLSASQREVVIRLARIHLGGTSNFHEADRLLEKVQQSLPADVSTDYERWQSQLAMQLRVLSLAGQNDLEGARRLLQDLASRGPEEIVRVLVGLERVGRQCSARTRRAVGELQLQAIAALNQESEELGPETSRFLLQSHAEALVATDQPRKALGIYRELRRRIPDERTLLRTIADLELRIGGKPELKAALKNWRELESQEAEGSAAWIEARYHVILTLNSLGQTQESQRLLTVTKLLYPGLGGPDWASRFAQLQDPQSLRR